VVMKVRKRGDFSRTVAHDVVQSDHSAIVSRYLLHEAQQAHYYGLASNIALASVISTPAEVMGLDHRIGFIKPGYDAGKRRLFFSTKP